MSVKIKEVIMKSFILFILLTSLLINSGCENPTDKGDPIAKSILGTVKDSQGNLISDAKIFIIYDFGQPDPPGSLKKLSELNSVVLDGPFTDFDNSGIKLYWTTYSETNNQGFEIERKTGNSDWTTIGFLAGRGTTTDTTYYEFIDPYIENDIYTFRLKIMEFDGSFEYSGEVEVNIDFLPNESGIEQNYPNPFDLSTTMHFRLRKPALVTIDINSFKNELVLPTVFQSELGPGNYQFIGEFSDTLPSNGYKLLIEFDEADSSYKFEMNILQTYQQYYPSIINTFPNAITTNGTFEVKYEDLPFGIEYVRTFDADPTPIYTFEISNNLKLVIYKPGYKVVEKDLTVNPDEGQEIEIILEAE